MSDDASALARHDAAQFELLRAEFPFLDEATLCGVMVQKADASLQLLRETFPDWDEATLRRMLSEQEGDAGAVADVCCTMGSPEVYHSSKLSIAAAAAPADRRSPVVLPDDFLRLPCMARDSPAVDEDLEFALRLQQDEFGAPAALRAPAAPRAAGPSEPGVLDKLMKDAGTNMFKGLNLAGAKMAQAKAKLLGGKGRAEPADAERSRYGRVELEDELSDDQQGSFVASPMAEAADAARRE
ncbi:hypothetical protein M885DRAFT_534154 [Pelagophyceae sp. CCMP2097]|nr:hypothetical protein M885DRAFT_534154 [Pelagophyceae sp. CCMP2097]